MSAALRAMAWLTLAIAALWATSTASVLAAQSRNVLVLFSNARLVPGNAEAELMFRLVGDVRHVSAASGGGVYVGLRFSSLSAVERDMLETLLGQGAAAPSAR